MGTEQWHSTSDRVFAIFFTVELVLRALAGRGWFFVDPHEWKWHWLDIFLVVTSILSDFGIGSNMSFFRLLRIFRVVRIARIVRVVHFFRHLRRMMLSIQQCFASLAWALTFLCLINFMFSIFFLNGASEYIRYHNYETDVRDSFRDWYRSLPQTMFALVASISGGVDWIEVMHPVREISWTYQVVFTFYVVFVVIGVVNVLTGVFLESAREVKDRDLIVQCEMEHLDSFVEEMFIFFKEFRLDSAGNISWEAFEDFIHQERVEAYLSSHLLETTHARLLFKMLDSDNNGSISIYEFVIGMLRLKGAAKAYDSRVLLHQISTLRKSVHSVEDLLVRLSAGVGLTCDV